MLSRTLLTAAVLTAGFAMLPLTGCVEHERRATYDDRRYDDRNVRYDDRRYDDRNVRYDDRAPVRSEHRIEVRVDR